MTNVRIKNLASEYDADTLKNNKDGLYLPVDGEGGTAKTTVAKLAAAVGGIAGSGGLPFIDWSKIDGVSYGSGLSFEQGQTQRTVDRTCMLHIYESTKVYINGVLVNGNSNPRSSDCICGFAPGIGISTIQSNGAVYFLKAGDTISCQSGANVRYALIPLL